MTLHHAAAAFVVALAALASATASYAQQKLVPAQSEIVFTSKQMGVPLEGRFRNFDAQIAFDGKQPEAAKIALTVDLASVSLNPEADEELAKPDWFNTKMSPQATFRSTGVKATGPGTFDVSGKLAIKSIGRDLVVPVTLAQSGATTTATGAFTIKRLDYKIGDNEWKDTSMVADPVQVRFKLVLTGVAPM